MKSGARPLAIVVSGDGLRFRDVPHLDLSGTVDRIVGVVDPKVAHLVETAVGHHVRGNGLINALTLIVEDVGAPLDDRSSGLEVTSFLVSGAIAATLHAFKEPLAQWCYRLMEHVMAQDHVICELNIVHKREDRRHPPQSVPSAERCVVILPHRGPESFLRLSVDSLLRQTHGSDICVAIDQEDVGTAFMADVADETRVHVFKLTPCPVGPYFARHVLSARSAAAVVAFQDSDDMALPHRLATLASAADAHGAGIVGSHELQVHQTHKKVYAIRYPLDVNTSLHRSGPNHQLLFPTSRVDRQVIERIGGFSTFRAFSLDVAFWLSASLTTRIVNVDEFLYVRRRHPDSLTMRPDIGTGSAIRREVVARRRADFSAILEGRLRLEDSSLAVRHGSSPVAFRNVKTGEVSMADIRHSFSSLRASGS